MQNIRQHKPFMNEEEIVAIQSCLSLYEDSIQILEWGSGNSTIHFSTYISSSSTWTAIEHDKKWAFTAKEMIAAYNLNNVQLYLIPPSEEYGGPPDDGDYNTFRNYITYPKVLGRKFQLILVDGRARVECLKHGWLLLEDNGLMILHDAQRLEYNSGIPANSYYVRMVNPRVQCEGNISTIFISKSISMINQVMLVLRAALPGYIDLTSSYNTENSSNDFVELSPIIASHIPSSTQNSINSNYLGDISSIVGVKINWQDVLKMPLIKLYAGDIPNNSNYKGVIGLSLTQNDCRHIQHDITKPLPLPENSVDSYQAEDVFEHIPYKSLLAVVDEIYRVLKSGAIFRLSIPDYGCDVLQNRSVKDEYGKIIFDPGGGGTPDTPGHLWFPEINNVKCLLSRSLFYKFGQIEYFHYYKTDGSFVVDKIDYSKGYVQRTPDFDERVKNPYRPMSMVIDLIKTSKPCSEHTSVVVQNSFNVNANNSGIQPKKNNSASIKQSVFGSTTLPTCVFLNTYYPAFLDNHYRNKPGLLSATYEVQHQSLQETCFGDSDFYSNGLQLAGWNAKDLIINCLPLQQAWAKENNFQGSGFNIAVEQIRRIKPQVVYFQDLSVATADFISRIRPYAQLIVGQIASSIPNGIILSYLDIIISSFPHFVQRFRKMGLTSYYQPLAFEPRVLEKLQKTSVSHPVTFIGGISPHHKDRTVFLTDLSTTIPIKFWGYGYSSLSDTSQLRQCYQGEAWGNQMFSILSRSAITINYHIDTAENYANNMRLFEATGCGALLLTDYKDNLCELFEIGKEVVAYRSVEEAVALVQYYLSNPTETQTIAKAGQMRTLRDHTYQKRMAHTAELLERHLRYKREKNQFSVPDLSKISYGYTPINTNQISEAMTSAWQNEEIPAKQRALVQKELADMYQGKPPQVFQVLVESVRPYVTDGDSVLEIGCASGYYYEILEYLLYKKIVYTGTDYSEPLIRMARNYYPKVKFHVANGNSLPFEDNLFFISISSCVLLHVLDYAEHISETIRVTQKYIVAHRTPICRESSTRLTKKFGYGVEMIELRFNEEEFLSEWYKNGVKLIRTIEYDTNLADDSFEVTYVFKKETSNR